MIHPDITRRLHEMFDATNAAFEAISRTSGSLKDANTANGIAIAAIGDANAAIGAAFDAHEDLIAAARASNVAALALLDTLSRTP